MRARIKRFTHILTLPSAHDAIRWWEMRRLLFNLIVVPVFALSVTLSIMMAGKTSLAAMVNRPGVVLIAIAVLFFAGTNIGYTMGWVSELIWSGGQTSITRPHRRLIFWMGTAAWVAICLIPLAGVLFLALAGALQ